LHVVACTVFGLKGKERLARKLRAIKDFKDR